MFLLIFSSNILRLWISWLFNMISTLTWKMTQILLAVPKIGVHISLFDPNFFFEWEELLIYNSIDIRWIWKMRTCTRCLQNFIIFFFLDGMIWYLTNLYKYIKFFNVHLLQILWHKHEPLKSKIRFKCI